MRGEIRRKEKKKRKRERKEGRKEGKKEREEKKGKFNGHGIFEEGRSINCQAILGGKIKKIKELL